MILSTQAGASQLGKVAAHWACKLTNRRSSKSGVLDSGATSGAGPAEDVDELEDTGQQSRKTFMFPDGRTMSATQKMMLKHNLRDGAREINIVPGMHTTLISVPKLADERYTTVFRDTVAEIYDNDTTMVMSNKPPILTAPCCKTTGLWRLDLNPEAEKTD